MQCTSFSKLFSDAKVHGHPSPAGLSGLSEQRQTWILRVSSAAFYALASFMIMVINKRILTVYKFPAFQVSTWYVKWNWCDY